eukprot:m.256524 g.256524  ORF g.256524 m.256524 type:complete len:1353 (+) comp19172_c2_seq7:2343-6401(+)
MAATDKGLPPLTRSPPALVESTVDQPQGDQATQPRHHPGNGRVAPAAPRAVSGWIPAGSATQVAPQVIRVAGELVSENTASRAPVLPGLVPAGGAAPPLTRASSPPSPSHQGREGRQDNGNQNQQEQRSQPQPTRQALRHPPPQSLDHLETRHSKLNGNLNGSRGHRHPPPHPQTPQHRTPGLAVQQLLGLKQREATLQNKIKTTNENLRLRLSSRERHLKSRLAMLDHRQQRKRRRVSAEAPSIAGSQQASVVPQSRGLQLTSVDPNTSVGTPPMARPTDGHLGASLPEPHDDRTTQQQPTQPDAPQLTATVQQPGSSEHRRSPVRNAGAHKQAPPLLETSAPPPPLAALLSAAAPSTASLAPPLVVEKQPSSTRNAQEQLSFTHLVQELEQADPASAQQTKSMSKRVAPTAPSPVAAQTSEPPAPVPRPLSASPASVGQPSETLPVTKPCVQPNKRADGVQSTDACSNTPQAAAGSATREYESATVATSPSKSASNTETSRTAPARAASPRGNKRSAADTTDSITQKRQCSPTRSSDTDSSESEGNAEATPTTLLYPLESHPIKLKFLMPKRTETPAVREERRLRQQQPDPSQPKTIEVVSTRRSRRRNHAKPKPAMRNPVSVPLAHGSLMGDPPVSLLNSGANKALSSGAPIVAAAPTSAVPTTPPPAPPPTTARTAPPVVGNDTEPNTVDGSSGSTMGSGGPTPVAPVAGTVSPAHAGKALQTDKEQAGASASQQQQLQAREDQQGEQEQGQNQEQGLMQRTSPQPPARELGEEPASALGQSWATAKPTAGASYTEPKDIPRVVTNEELTDAVKDVPSAATGDKPMDVTNDALLAPTEESVDVSSSATDGEPLGGVVNVTNSATRAEPTYMAKDVPEPMDVAADQPKDLAVVATTATDPTATATDPTATATGATHGVVGTEARRPVSTAGGAVVQGGVEAAQKDTEEEVGAPLEAAGISPGDSMQFCDEDGNWWLSKVVEVNVSAETAKLHFVGWASAYDKWVPVSSMRTAKASIARQLEKLQKLRYKAPGYGRDLVAEAMKEWTCQHCTLINSGATCNACKSMRPRTRSRRASDKKQGANDGANNAVAASFTATTTAPRKTPKFPFTCVPCVTSFADRDQFRRHLKEYGHKLRVEQMAQEQFPAAAPAGLVVDQAEGLVSSMGVDDGDRGGDSEEDTKQAFERAVARGATAANAWAAYASGRRRSGDLGNGAGVNDGMSEDVMGCDSGSLSEDDNTTQCQQCSKPIGVCAVVLCGACVTRNMRERNGHVRGTLLRHPLVCKYREMLTAVHRLHGLAGDTSELAPVGDLRHAADETLLLATMVGVSRDVKQRLRQLRARHTETDHPAE